jgi:hypothetical protein
MVIDEHIDPDHDVYKDKVIAKYSLLCKDAKTEDENFKNIKNKLLSQVSQGKKITFGNKCTLTEGIAPVDDLTPHLSSQVLSKRPIWNRLIADNEPLPLKDKVEFRSMMHLMSSYHGTQVSSVIAYKNPHVRFVLVQKIFRNHISGSCSVLQQNYKNGLKALKDPEVRKVLAEKAELVEWKLIDELARKHSVTMINKSYTSNLGLLEKYMDPACKGVMRPLFQEFYKEKGELVETISKRMNLFYDQEPFLTIQSAGNEGIEINSFIEHFECYKSDHHLIVGSYEIDKSRSSFSNHGDCVDLYALGNKVVVSNPRNFLTIAGGTSFSAPLTARYISFEFDRNQTPSEILSKLKKQMDEKRFLVFSEHFRYAAYRAHPQFRLVGGGIEAWLDHDKIDTGVIGAGVF